MQLSQTRRRRRRRRPESWSFSSSSSSSSPRWRGSRVAAIVAALAVGGTVLLAPGAANAAPMVVDDAYGVTAETSFSPPAGAGVLANDSEVGFPGAGVFIVTQPAHGTLMVPDNSGAFTYTPNVWFGGSDSFTYCITFGAGCLSNTATVSLTVHSTIDRIGAADRFAQSAAVSASRFAPGVDTVFVASGAVFPDALSAGAAAGVSKGPVLLVSKDTVSDAVRAELTRLAAKKIVLLGGVNTASSAVEAALHDFAPDVRRIAGADRYDVSAAVSASVFPPGPRARVAYVASGEVFPDALSASAVAGAVDAPVLLVQKGVVPAAIRAELTRLAPSAIIVVGGANSVSDDVLTTLRGISPTVLRAAGADRYAVSAAVSSSEFTPPQSHVVYVASGEVFPDALSGSPAAISRFAPVLLVSKNSIPGPIDAELTRLHPNHIVVLGGTNSISAQVERDLQKYLAH
ncbi:cell wall-binding repeat-containing protein [Herbiconiux daphne]|uniref:Cell wall-binding repeat-containing protein n=1 Tax=Herbiconiux daphne TaxID=2970914 RepID=A0ABT2H5N1_9MICO|nr:cell wall-binding repeat-containing protein [Herbiconiux daphne]MCS5735245.1 cell wall-binding repeat-containing protein [Herbiconiux daphne]